MIRFDEAASERNMTLACAALSLSRLPENSLFSQLTEPLVETATDKSILRLFEAVALELAEARTGMRAVLGTLMKQILLLFLRANNEREGGHSLLRCAMASSGLNAAVQCVLNRPQDPHTIGDLAAKAGMSRTCFNSQFTSTYGCTPMTFVNSVRLERAAQMLETSGLPIKGVAGNVGYASRSHFSRAFRERYGMDPSSYREQVRERVSDRESA
jgi:transcriptional regulator GlxA family with amidase domain